MSENPSQGKVHLHVGKKVKIKNLREEFKEDAGRIKTITKILPNFEELRAFGLDGDDGIWCIQDFEYCVDHPDLIMV